MSEEVIIEPTIGTSETSYSTPQDVFGYVPNPIGDAVGAFGAKVSDFFTNLFNPEPTPTEDTSVNTRTPTARINPNLVIGSAAAVAVPTIIYATATNPGVQKTAQAFAPGFNSLSSAGQSITSALSSNPLILIGLLALGAIVILKK